MREVVTVVKDRDKVVLVKEDNSILASFKDGDIYLVPNCKRLFHVSVHQKKVELYQLNYKDEVQNSTFAVCGKKYAFATNAAAAKHGMFHLIKEQKTEKMV